jgi:hypothetical protein
VLNRLLILKAEMGINSKDMNKWDDEMTELKQKNSSFKRSIILNVVGLVALASGNVSRKNPFVRWTFPW